MSKIKLTSSNPTILSMEAQESFLLLEDDVAVDISDVLELARQGQALIDHSRLLIQEIKQYYPVSSSLLTNLNAPQNNNSGTCKSLTNLSSEKHPSSSSSYQLNLTRAKSLTNIPLDTTQKVTESNSEKELREIHYNVIQNEIDGYSDVESFTTASEADDDFNIGVKKDFIIASIKEDIGTQTPFVVPKVTDASIQTSCDDELKLNFLPPVLEAVPKSLNRDNAELNLLPDTIDTKDGSRVSKDCQVPLSSISMLPSPASSRPSPSSSSTSFHCSLSKPYLTSTDRASSTSNSSLFNFNDNFNPSLFSLPFPNLLKKVKSFTFPPKSSHLFFKVLSKPQKIARKVKRNFRKITLPFRKYKSETFLNPNIENKRDRAPLIFHSNLMDPLYKNKVPTLTSRLLVQKTSLINESLVSKASIPEARASSYKKKSFFANFLSFTSNLAKITTSQISSKMKAAPSLVSIKDIQGRFGLSSDLMTITRNFPVLSSSSRSSIPKLASSSENVIPVSSKIFIFLFSFFPSFYVPVSSNQEISELTLKISTNTSLSSSESKHQSSKLDVLKRPSSLMDESEKIPTEFPGHILKSQQSGFFSSSLSSLLSSNHLPTTVNKKSLSNTPPGSYDQFITPSTSSLKKNQCCIDTSFSLESDIPSSPCLLSFTSVESLKRENTYREVEINPETDFSSDPINDDEYLVLEPIPTGGTLRCALEQEKKGVNTFASPLQVIRRPLKVQDACMNTDPLPLSYSHRVYRRMKYIAFCSYHFPSFVKKYGLFETLCSMALD